jgi:tetratricopeptide (TPR) repeat protein
MKRCLAAGLAWVVLALAASSPALSQAQSPAKDASRHFQRGVDLYSEGDVRGALVEFRRAYTLLPRATVLYNIGQAEYQLQEYAAALRTLERFLADTGPTAAHRAEVEQTVEILRGRVGHIALTSDRAGCDVALDDMSVGITPLAEPILVSIGRRRVSVSCPDGERLARDAEVAGGQTVAIDLRLGPARSNAFTGGERPRSSGRGIAAGWILGAGLGVATLATYGAALVQSRKLAALRGRYPVTAAQLTNQARLTSRLALTGDILAATTLVVVGLTAYFRASDPDDSSVDVVATGLGPGLRGSF